MTQRPVAESTTRRRSPSGAVHVIAVRSRAISRDTAVFSPSQAAISREIAASTSHSGTPNQSG
ncbi:hypothetical protein [Saccharopolyspora sp. 5N708]|uniref:hypothetical protein n=1 Tax=Saccharopolyspora sp. 5N708 TaxID=3457424 RepID=UPI003FD2EF52